MQEDNVVLSDVHLATTNDDYGAFDYNSLHIKGNANIFFKK